jgi:hypothetical protein
MVKETHHDIYEASCSRFPEVLEVLDFSLLKIFWNKLEENCALSLP